MRTIAISIINQMNMENDFNIRFEGSTLFIVLGFELSTAYAPVLKEHLEQYVGQDIKRIVFDTTDLVYISSSGIRTIIYAQQQIGHSPEIVFVNCAQEIYDAFEITGLNHYITFMDDERKNLLAEKTDGEDNDAWRQKMADAKQKMLDHFAAHNDVVMYQMRLGRDDD